MSASTELPTAASPDELAGRIRSSVLGGLEVLCIYIGDQLGFYRALHDGGPATAPELAARAGAAVRYTREWLEQQTTAGFLACDNPRDAALERRFRLPDGYEQVLVEAENLLAMAPMAEVFVGVSHPLPRLLQAFRTGAGVPYAAYGAAMQVGQARANRPMFTHLLAQEWIAAMPDIDARLRADPPARIADIGMGQGWSSIVLARAYPRVTIDGLDLDAPSVAAARVNARAAGDDIAGRVTFHVRDAGDPALANRYDFALAIECIHDMADPVAALNAMRRLVGSGGTVLIVDERVQDAFTPHGDETERMMYSFSVLHCLPVGMAEQPSVETGTVMRRDTFRAYAAAAGFRDVAELPIEHETSRFYRLTA